MARIWYSICGEGMGHAIRSEPFLKELMKNNEILITSYGRPYHYLKRLFPKNTIKIRGNHFYYKKNKVNLLKTVLIAVLLFPFNLIYDLFKLRYIIKFKPTHIISDFETLSHYYAFITKIKFLSFTNIHVITKAEYKLKPPVYLLPLMRFILYPETGRYILVFFSKLKLKPKTKLFMPVLRKEVKSAIVKEKNQILVYQTSNTNTDMISELDKSGFKYLVYGFGNYEHKNKKIKFKEFNDKEFVKDLAESKFLITNGGISTIFEALYLKKPILSNPVENQFEQVLNAYYLEKEGFGKYAKKITKEDIDKFDKDTNKYKKNIEKLKWDDKKLINEINNFVKS